LWQQLTDLEEMPGPRLTFTTSANTPDAIAFLADEPVAERIVFHAACGRLHVWPAEAEAAKLVEALGKWGFVLVEARGFRAHPLAAQPAVIALRRSIRRAMDPLGVLALGG
jgi:hypothetical protein